MKKLFLLSLVAVYCLSSCKKDHTSKIVPVKMDTLQGSITASMTLDASKSYLLKGQVYVKSNATLTIPAGVKVYAQVNPDRSAKSVLVITRGSKININGTIDKPVIFTSASSSPMPGDW